MPTNQNWLSYQIQWFALPSNRFETPHIDIVGPLPPPESRPEQSYQIPARYLSTMIDRCTGWIEATLLVNITASDVADAFLDSWVSRFGVPLYVVTDCGSQFESEFFSLVSSAIGFHRLRTTTYHPQTNGKVEWMHRTLKTIFKTKSGKWYFHLPLALQAMRISSNEVAIFPFMKVTGEHPMVLRILTSLNNDPCQIKRTIDDILSDSQTSKLRKTQSYIPKNLGNRQGSAKLWKALL